jgi:tetratricopeptide (TPR) repeat protein
MTDPLAQLRAALADRYAIEHELGAGGMATVYLAEDLKHQRDVAIKVLRPELAAALGHERFLREITTTAALHHPHILGLYDSGEADGFLYYVMPYVEGESLRERLDRERQLAVDDALRIGREVADALSYAHQRGVIHRDIKPENILLESGHAQVADFGIARAVSAAGGEKLTQTGMVVGTPLYMSPEQAAGDSVDPRSDQYSLACVLYEMLAGMPPFSAPTALALMARHALDPVPPLTTTRPSLPPHVSAALERALAKAPADRFPTAMEWLDAMLSPAAEAASPTSPRTPVSVDVGTETRTPLIGRERERTELDQMLDNASGGHGGLVLLGGEPGVGKTRLAEELLADGRHRGMLALVGHAYEDEGTPLVTVVEILEDIAQLVPANLLRRHLGDEAAEIATLMPELRRRFPDITDPVEVPPEQRRRVLFNGVVAFLERLSRGQPTVILLDDLHWADESSLALLLHHLTPRLAGIPLLVIGTYRDVELEVGRPLAKALSTLTRQRLVERRAIRRLPQDAVSAMLGALGGSAPPRELVDIIFHETEGNPFFVEEVFRHLQEEGKLLADDGRWRTDLSREELDVPEGVRLVVGRRLERLDENTVKTLTVAAVLGRRFDLGLTEEGAALDPASFLDAIEEAETARLVAPATDARGSYEFNHELIRQTVLSGLSLLRRQRTHLEVAQLIERRHTDALEAQASTLAWHFYQAGAAAPTEKVVEYALMAGERALAKSAYEEAAGHFNRGLELKGDDAADSETARLLFGLGRSQAALLDVHHLEAAVATLAKAFEIHVAAGEVASAVEAAAYPVFVTAGHRKGAGELLSRALELVPPDSHDAGRLLHRYGWTVSQEEGDYDKAMNALDRAQVIAEREDDVALRMTTLASMTFVHAIHLRLPEVVRDASEALTLARRVGSPFVEMNAQAFLAAGLDMTGKLSEAAPLWSPCVALAEKLADRTWLATMLWFAAASARLGGRWEEAEQRLQRGLEVWPEDPRLLGERAMLEAHLGRYDEAEDLLDRVIEVMQSTPPGPTDEYSHPAMALAGVAYLTGSTARLEAAKRAADPVISSPFVTPFLASWTRAGLAVVSTMEGDARRASDLYAAFEAHRGTFVPGGSPACVDRILGMLSSSLGRLDDADEHFEQAIVGCRQGGYMLDLAWALYERAGALGRRDRDASVREIATLLKESLALADELGLTPLRERVRALQREV